MFGRRKQDDNEKKGGKVTSINRLIVGAVIGAAVGSVVGATLAPKSGKETRKAIADEFDKLKDSGDNKAKSLLRRLRLYLKRRNEARRK